MWKDLFVKRKYATLKITQKDSERIDNISLDDIDVNMFTKCPSCGEILINMDLENNLKVCYKCNYHFRIGSKERINITFDKGSIEYFDNNMKSLNPLGFIDYSQKLKSLSKSLGINEAVVTGKAKINGYDLCFGVMEPNFIMGSMGSVVGEKLSRMFEKAIELNLPVVVFCASGGARMQEGMLSLCQMAKVSAAVKMHSNKGLLYISVITDPTTGGVTASFASLGDIIIAEPKATIGFAGRRVIEQTIKQKLPDEFQSAEFMLEHGFIDMIVERKKMKETLSNILKIHLGVKK